MVVDALLLYFGVFVTSHATLAELGELVGGSAQGALILEQLVVSQHGGVTFPLR